MARLKLTSDCRAVNMLSLYTMWAELILPPQKGTGVEKMRDRGREQTREQSGRPSSLYVDEVGQINDVVIRFIYNACRASSAFLLLNGV
ncbi:hypothetical protein KIN20_008195 [Parelaphostrongylus tenuis]|uniref:Uncharacterized protein n=1 Tax=Parelaphostrongylus tenuis TaxID=148309 RepID=A0AAD5M4E8_PARTN|nr:hypothetical protein KIN20_008195 [Parelaphostrongylus tenuis]